MLIEIEGGAMIGYCATARNGIASAPQRLMSRARTEAKTGRSMKKAGIDQIFQRAGALWVAPADCRDGCSARRSSCHGFGSTTSPSENF